MAVPRLVSYIKQQMNAGYDINTIRNFLIRSGYDAREIAEAVDFIYGKKKKEFPWLILFGAVGVVFIIVLILFFILGGEEVPVKTPVTPTVEQPEISEEAPEVIQEEVQELPKCPETCDDNNICTKDYCGIETAYQCVNEDLLTCCGNGICEVRESYSNCPDDCEEIESPFPVQETIGDVIAKAKDLAKDNPSAGANYCQKQSQENFKDSCYVAVAEASKKSSYCEQVISNIKRDSCYTTAVLNGDYSVCDKIQDHYLQLSCQSLAEAQ